MKFIMFSHPSFPCKIVSGIKTSTMRPVGVSCKPRYLPGETVSARTWTGKAYRSPQKEFETILIYSCDYIWFDAKGGRFLSMGFEMDIAKLAASEGLTQTDLVKWFRSGFRGRGRWLWMYSFGVAQKPQSHFM